MMNVDPRKSKLEMLLERVRRNRHRVGASRSVADDDASAGEAKVAAVQQDAFVEEDEYPTGEHEPLPEIQVGPGVEIEMDVGDAPLPLEMASDIETSVERPVVPQAPVHGLSEVAGEEEVVTVDEPYEALEPELVQPEPEPEPVMVPPEAGVPSAAVASVAEQSAAADLGPSDEMETRSYSFTPPEHANVAQFVKTPPRRTWTLQAVLDRAWKLGES
jgi:hypothetical protein